jgi:hypothetical protein
MKKTERIAIFIDLANSEDLDLKWIMKEANEAGSIEEARCYGDFQQQHLAEIALDLYALGIMMVHCPSWNNGNDTRKRSDDRLLEKGVHDTLNRRPLISTYILVTSDSDIIPTCHSIVERNKRLVLYSFKDEELGKILRSCGFDIRQTPKRTGEANNGDLTKEEIVKGIDRLEKTSRYITFMQTVSRICNGDVVIKGRIQQQLSDFIQQGIVEQYEHRIPAIRLNHRHALVVSALDNTKERSGADIRPSELLGRQ